MSSMNTKASAVVMSKNFAGFTCWSANLMPRSSASWIVVAPNRTESKVAT